LHSLPRRGFSADRAEGNPEKKVSHRHGGNGNVSYLCNPFQKGGPEANSAPGRRKKKFPGSLAKKRNLPTFAAPSRKGCPRQPDEGKGEKKFPEALAKREVLRTFAAASGKEAFRRRRGREKKSEKMLAERENLPTFAAASERKSFRRPGGEGKKRKKSRQGLGNEESLLTFAAPSGREGKTAERLSHSPTTGWWEVL